MLIGYARASVITQQEELEAVTEELDSLGCDSVFIEELSTAPNRKTLRACIDFCSDGDAILVTKLEHLANSVADFCQIQKELQAKNVGLRVNELGLDTLTPQGLEMLSVFESIARFEREVTRCRQREGIAKAKAEGKYKGRKPTCDEAKTLIEAMIINGKKPREIMEKVEIGKTTFYKIKKELSQNDAS
ncbi:recombinase family protein [Vibrio lamellibrachiae]|uniref:recombinase family protein n=1 Tax=Vibrio lamellibrachiae TaxID=2910253 RepID=UPI003D0C81EE